MSPAVYTHQLDADPRPAPLTPEQSASLFAKELPPALYADLDGCVGLCPGRPLMPDMAGGEVIIDRSYAAGMVSEQTRADRIATTYLHEFAHRLTPGAGHNAIFAMVYSALLFRAYKSEADVVRFLRWYDVKDEANLGAAFGLAVAFGRLHALTTTPAEELAKRARSRFDEEKQAAWHACMQAAREEMAEQRKLDTDFFEKQLARSEAKVLSLMTEKGRLSKKLASADSLAKRAIERFEKVKCTLICASLFVAVLLVSGVA